MTTFVRTCVSLSPIFFFIYYCNSIKQNFSKERIDVTSIQQFFMFSIFHTFCGPYSENEKWAIFQIYTVAHEEHLLWDIVVFVNRAENTPWTSWIHLLEDSPCCSSDSSKSSPLSTFTVNVCSYIYNICINSLIHKYFLARWFFKIMSCFTIYV